MKFLKIILLFIFPSIILFSCSGNNSSNTPVGNPEESSQSVTPPSSSGNASWSCVIDGELASGNIMDKDEQYNAGYTTDVDKGKSLQFKLTNIKTDDPLASFTRSLRFSIPDKSGNMTFGHDEDAWGIQVNIIPEKVGDAFPVATAQYNSDSITVNITNLTGSRVAGTFSGKFMLGPDTPKGGKDFINITDGKFDIPMSTTHNMPM